MNYVTIKEAERELDWSIKECRDRVEEGKDPAEDVAAHECEGIDRVKRSIFAQDFRKFGSNA